MGFRLTLKFTTAPRADLVFAPVSIQRTVSARSFEEKKSEPIRRARVAGRGSVCAAAGVRTFAPLAESATLLRFGQPTQAARAAF
jgi:hypothetical protein